MLKASITVLAAAIIVLDAASASLAKDHGSGPPTIDVQKTCRENIGALRSLLGADILQTEDVCVSDEHSARDELVKEWASYPALAKSLCIQPQEYLPGYVEWLTCIQMTRDVLQLRKERQTNASNSATRGVGPASRECPIVNYNENGNVSSVINCRGLGIGH